MSELPTSTVTSDVSTSANHSNSSSDSKSRANELVASMLRKHALMNEEPSTAFSSSMLLSTKHSPIHELEEEGKELQFAHQKQLVSSKTTLTNTTSLRTLTDQVASFLSLAPNTPPVMMESTTLSNIRSEQEENINANNNEQHNCNEEHFDGSSNSKCNNNDKCTSESECYVELNVVAGVLENKSNTWKNKANCKDGILLPTAQTVSAFEESKAHEAKAMLSLLDALTPSSYSHNSDESHYNSRTTNKIVSLDKQNENGNNKQVNEDSVESCDDGTSDSDSSVVIMDADELDSEDSSDRDEGDDNNNSNYNNYDNDDEQCEKRCKIDRDIPSASNNQHHKIIELQSTHHEQKKL